MPYGSTGFGNWFSVNGVGLLPYPAIEEQWIILFALFWIAAEKTDTELWKTLLVTKYGEKLDNPSYHCSSTIVENVATLTYFY